MIPPTMPPSSTPPSRLLPFLLLLLLPLLPAASIVQGLNPHMRQAFQPHNVTSDASPPKRVLAAKSTTWQTLRGLPPLIIARGGSSGLFPDQTVPAYQIALNDSVSSSISLFCDLQLTKDRVGLCRTNIDLSNSTTIFQVYPNASNSYEVNGALVTGYFSIDYTAADLAATVGAAQATTSRTSVYDGLFPLLQPENVTSIPLQFLFWLNVEYANFFEQHSLNMTSYVRSAMNALPITYLSSPEVEFLKSIKAEEGRSNTSLILRFLDKGMTEPTTNVTYGSLLSNLTEIKSYASGILVPKEYIWPINYKTSYLEPQTTLVQDAHKVGLEVYASGFVNDNVLPVYNYSFNPILEYSQFFSSTGAIVDGVLTDFPMTASEALACYGGSSRLSTSKLETRGGNPLIISHNGASGDYPGCTLPAYQEALNDGANYIDCSIQMTKDRIPICRESPNLLANTNIGQNPNFYPSRASTISQFQEQQGIFTVNMTMKEISNLKARMYSPEFFFGINRNRAYDGLYDILTLSNFLSFAKNASNIGVLIDIQKAVFMENVLNLDVVGAVISVLNSSGYESPEQVLIQSEDSAVLERFKQLTPYKLVYRIPSDNFTVPLSVIKQIKQFADTVNLDRGLVTSIATVYQQQSFLANATSIVQDFHSQNISVFVSYLRNEFVALPFDYEADPTMEINTLVQFYKVDGLITDFPATSRAYLNNGCGNLKAEIGGFDYPMQLVLPGQLLTETVPPDSSAKPSPVPPPLDVSEPALPPSSITPRGSSPSTTPSASRPPNSTSPSTSSPAPGFSQSGGGLQLSSHVLLLIASFFASICFNKLS